MIHVFVLMIYLGEGQLISGDMMFRNVTECNYFAKELTKTYGNYKYSNQVPMEQRRTAYCVPRLVDATKTKVY